MPKLLAGNKTDFDRFPEDQIHRWQYSNGVDGQSKWNGCTCSRTWFNNTNPVRDILSKTRSKWWRWIFHANPWLCFFRTWKNWNTKYSALKILLIKHMVRFSKNDSIFYMVVNGPYQHRLFDFWLGFWVINRIPMSNRTSCSMMGPISNSSVT